MSYRTRADAARTARERADLAMFRWKDYATAIVWDGMPLQDAIARDRELSQLWHEAARLDRLAVLAEREAAR